MRTSSCPLHSICLALRRRPLGAHLEIVRPIYLCIDDSQVCRRRPSSASHRRLDVIRQLRPPKGEKDMPYAELNSLYHHVLSNIDNIETFKQVLGTLIVVNPELYYHGQEIQYTHDMDDWLFWQPGESKACLSQLASVIECDEYGHISISHASMSDFLLDLSRSQQFYICRESVLSDGALGLRHLRQKEHDKKSELIQPSRNFILWVLIFHMFYPRF